MRNITGKNEITIVALDHNAVDIHNERTTKLYELKDKLNISEEDFTIILKNSKFIRDGIPEGTPDGGKIENKKEENAEIRSAQLETRNILKKYGYEIATVGGTGGNKAYYALHTIKSFCPGVKVKSVLIGCLGNDEIGRIAKDWIDKTEMQLYDFGKTTEVTRLSSILVQEKVFNRQVRKSTDFNPPEEFKNPELIEKTVAKLNPDMFFAEASLEGIFKNALPKFLEKLHETCAVYFGVATNDVYLKTDEKDKKRINKEEVIFHRELTKFADGISANETEIVKLLTNPLLKGNIDGVEAPIFKKTLKKMKELIKGNWTDDQIMLLTFGAHGAGAYTKHIAAKSSAENVENIVNTIGAGDTYTSCFFSYLKAQEINGVNLSWGKDKNSNFDAGVIVKEFLNAHRYAARMSAAVIQQLGAQLEPEKIHEIVDQCKKEFSTVELTKEPTELKNINSPAFKK